MVRSHALAPGHFRRLRAWNYSKGASLFITISTEPRRALFGRVEDGAMRLSPLGYEVLAALEAMPRLNPGIFLFGHVVMPDHVHLNLHLAPGFPEPLKALGEAVRRFKHHTSKVARGGIPCASTIAPTRAPAEMRGVTPRTSTISEV